MRKVMVGTPSYDGRIEVFYADALRRTEKLFTEHGIALAPIYMAYDALVQRARNDLVKIAIEHEFDDLLFIDSDIIWDPAWALKFIEYPVDCVGGAYRKKTDEQELYAVRAQLPIPVDLKTGLLIVDGIGTGFLRLSRRALLALWERSQRYVNEGRECRMVFDLAIINGQLQSEDIVMCDKLKDAGINVYVDPSFTCTHIGIKQYRGDFAAYIAKRTAKCSVAATA